ncbi:L-rhamnose/proton symporter RhaT [Dysgonomonas sp. 521]|uniref:L-rhamnose/proton symporter RhaT n=1 Tax=Dysgonomonas sp. 521 TaxID=2302932 RepID=UPI0013D48D93|nr:L-rhamnose/proton symporter RhaT [Dysgonomonas sp. 521]NDV93982.1 L-rhamnose/proton symporter RhaT [Dysgonomonas sp. 521]
MNTIIGLIIIAIGSLGQSSSYVPINKVKNWSWECFWLIQGIFAWLLFPLLGALIALPSGVSLIDVWSAAGDGMWKAIGFGVLWGIGGLTFGLSMRYLGVALGQSLSLGTCSAFGTLIPAILGGQDLFSGDGLILLIGVSIAIAGIAIIGYAGALKSQNMSEEEKKKAVKDFALKKGILIALLAGVMSACFNLGLEAGAPIKAHLASLGANELLVLNPVILLVTIGGFITNACYCLFQNYKNKTFSDYTTASASTWVNNLIFCALAGLLWYSQFFGLGIGQSFFEPGSVMMAFSWSILMSLNVIFSNLWGIILKEWKGSGQKTIAVLITGLAVLIISIILPQILK